MHLEPTLEAPILLDRRTDLVIIFTLGEGDAATTHACPVSGLGWGEDGFEP